eukprot:45029_1
MVASTIPQLTTLVYALLYSRVNVGNGQLYTTHVALFPSRDVLCKPNLKMCRIDCDLADHGYTNVYDCNNVDICFFMCNQPLCGRRAIINATNAKSLKITQDSNANKCLLNATVISPSNGSAHLFSRSKNGFQYMNIYATSTDHSNTKEIIIDTTQAINNSKYLGMNVFAATSDYLRVDIGANLTWKSATVECPVDSPYNGSDPSPCMIDATHGTMDQITIVAPQGTPKNVIIEDCNDCNDVQIICKDIDALNGLDKGDRALYPWNATSDCWKIAPTSAPTTLTKDPTLSPFILTQTTSSTPIEITVASVVPSDADISSYSPGSDRLQLFPALGYIIGAVVGTVLLAIGACYWYEIKHNYKTIKHSMVELARQYTRTEVENDDHEEDDDDDAVDISLSLELTPLGDLVAALE